VHKKSNFTAIHTYLTLLYNHQGASYWGCRDYIIGKGVLRVDYSVGKKVVPDNKLISKFTWRFQLNHSFVFCNIESTNLTSPKWLSESRWDVEIEVWWHITTRTSIYIFGKIRTPDWNIILKMWSHIHFIKKDKHVRSNNVTSWSTYIALADALWHWKDGLISPNPFLHFLYSLQFVGRWNYLS